MITLHIHTQDAGVPFLIDGQIVYLRGTLTLGCADNLAANLMAGYKSLTSAFRKCRSCMAIATEMKTKVCNIFCHNIIYIRYVYSFMKTNFS